MWEIKKSLRELLMMLCEYAHVKILHLLSSSFCNSLLFLLILEYFECRVLRHNILTNNYITFFNVPSPLCYELTITKHIFI